MEDIAVGAIGGLVGVSLVLAKGLVEAVLKRNGHNELEKEMTSLANAMRIAIDNTEALRRTSHDIVKIQEKIVTLQQLHEQGAKARDELARQYREGAVNGLVKSADGIERVLTDAVQNGKVALINCPALQRESHREPYGR